MTRSLPLTLELLPFSVVFVALVYCGLTGEDLLNRWTLWAIVLEFAVSVLWLATGRARELWRVPCLLAPLAVLYPWAVIPSHLGVGLGSLPSFLGWLTRYPSLGSFNAEILAGLGCVLGASAMPVLFAVMARRPRPWLQLGLFVLALVPWVPVVLRLDLEMVALAVLGFPSLFSPEPVTFYAAAFGPIIRALAMLGMLVGVIQMFWRQNTRIGNT